MTQLFNYSDCGENPVACGACDSCTGLPGRLIGPYPIDNDQDYPSYDVVGRL